MSRRSLSPCPKFFWKHLRLPENATHPLRTCCHSLVSYQDRYLIAFAGGSLTGMSKEVFIYDLDRNEWERKRIQHTDFVPARIIHSAVIYKRQMIVYGGHSDNPPGVLDDVLSLDLERWSWGSIGPAPPEPDGPGAREFHTAHIYQDRMYVIMGHTQDQSEPPTGSLIWYFDLLQRTWHAVPPPELEFADDAPPYPLGGHSAAVEGDIVYLFGGTSSRTPLEESQYSNELFTFNFRTHRWRRIRAAPEPQPPARYGSGLTVCDGVVYAFGGDRSGSVVFGDFWRIDTTATLPVWEELPLLEPNSVATRTHFPSSSFSPLTDVPTPPPRPPPEEEEVFFASSGQGAGAGEDPHNGLVHSPSEVADGGSHSWWTPRSWHNMERPSPRTGMGYATARGAFFILGGETFRPPPPRSGHRFAEGEAPSALPLGLTTMLRGMPVEAAEYSNELFTYPLTVSCASSLRDAASRWLSSVWTRDGRWMPRQVGQLQETEAPGVLFSLQACLPTALDLMNETSTPVADEETG